MIVFIVYLLFCCLITVTYVFENYGDFRKGGIWTIRIVLKGFLAGFTPIVNIIELLWLLT